MLETISLGDELTFTIGAGDSNRLTCDDASIPTDDTNLIIRAANALRDVYGRTDATEVELTKRIPAQGGLGGASSNAAVALLALNALWGDGRSRVEEVLDPGSLGADVPFFLVGGRCLATGTGTTVTALPDEPRQHLIVATPNAKIATASAYAALNAGSLTTSDSDSILSSFVADRFSADSGLWPLCNDFERVIFEIEPEIERAKNALLEAGARGALLSGSGSSVFGVFADAEARDRARESLRSEEGWRVFSCHTLSRDEYFRAMNSSGFPALTLS